MAPGGTEDPTGHPGSVSRLPARRGLEHVLSVLGASVLRIPLAALASILVARLLGPGQLGVYVFLMLFNTVLAPLLNLGIPTGINYYLSRRRYSPGDVAMTSATLGLLQGCAIAALVGAGWHLDWLGETARQAPPRLVVAVLLLMPLTSMDTMLDGVLKGGGSFRAQSAIQVVNGVLTPVLLLAAVASGRIGLPAVIGVQWLATLLTLCASISTVARLHGFPLAWRTDFVRACLGYGIRAWAGNVMLQLSLRLDQVVLGMLQAPAQLGRYSIAVSLTERLWILPNAVGPILFNRVCGAEDRRQAEREVERAHRILVPSVAVGGVVLALLGWVLVPVLYGRDFSESATCIVLLLPGSLAMVSSKVLTKYLAGTGRPLLTTYATAAGGAVAALGYALLIPSFGARGAAVATSFSYATMAFLCLHFYRQPHGPSRPHLWVPGSADLQWARGRLQGLRTQWATALRGRSDEKGGFPERGQ